MSEIKFNDEEIREIEELKKQLRDIKQRGKFMRFYSMIRKGTSKIKHSKMSEVEKKKALIELTREIGAQAVKTIRSNKAPILIQKRGAEK